MQPVVASLLAIVNDPQRNNDAKLGDSLLILHRNTMEGLALDPIDNSRHDAWNIAGLYFMRIGDFERARAVYDDMNQWFLLRQTEGRRRYHKGTAYHNLGVALLGLQRITDARHNILLAFIEDAISFEDPSGAPAYIALRQIFGISNDFLQEAMRTARRTAPENQINPENIYEQIMRIPGILTIPAPQQEMPINPLEEYERNIFNVDKTRLKDILQQVEQASTTQEKKTSLETLSETLLSSVQGWSVIASTRTRTGELDRIIRNENSGHPFLSGLGSHILIECKNWSKKVGSSHIRIFVDKMAEHRLTAGIMLTRNGITGNDSRDAKGRIVSKFQEDGTITIVLTKEDLERVIGCYNLIRLLKEKAEDIRFGRL